MRANMLTEPSHETATRFRLLYEKRIAAQLTQRRLEQTIAQWRREAEARALHKLQQYERRGPCPRGDTACLRETLLAKVTRFPQTPSVLFQAVRDDYGTVGERRLWRMMQMLCQEGLIERVGQFRHPDGYQRVRH